MSEERLVFEQQLSNRHNLKQNINIYFLFPINPENLIAVWTGMKDKKLVILAVIGISIITYMFLASKFFHLSL